MTTPGPDTTVPIGVYRGPGCGTAAIEAYETFLSMPSGTTVNYVLDYMLDKPTWAQFEAGALPTSTNGTASTQNVTVWSGQLGSRTLMLGVPACVQETTWTQEAAGGNDSHWKALGATLVNAGFGDAVLRIGREFNGTWYPWHVDEGGQSSYIHGYSHIVEVLRSVTGATFTFMWNPTIGTGSLNKKGAESCYPGDSCVDVIGIDIYDGDWSGIYNNSYTRTEAQQQKVWNNFLTQWDGLRGWQNLASNHHKPLAYPEWGLRLWLDDGVYHGGGDDPVFVDQMAAWLTSNSAWMHAFWEDRGMGVMDPDNAAGRLIAVPKSRQAFLTEFGYGG